MKHVRSYAYYLKYKQIIDNKFRKMTLLNFLYFLISISLLFSNRKVINMKFSFEEQVIMFLIFEESEHSEIQL